MSLSVILAVVFSVLLVGGAIAALIARRPLAADRTKLDWYIRSAFDRTLVGIGFVDTDGRWLVTNVRLLQLLGYGATELKKVPLRQLTHPQDRKREAALFATLQGGRSAAYTIVKRLQRKGGQYHEYRVQMTRIADAPAVYQCVIDETGSDESLLDQVGAALDELEGAAVVRCDNTGTITGWNRGAERLFGYSAAEIAGSSWTRLSPGDAAGAMRRLTSAKRSGVRRASERRVRSDGKEIEVRSTIVPYGRPHQLAGFLDICRPATDADSEALRDEITNLHRTLASARASNVELSTKVRLLATALRKTITRDAAATPKPAASEAKPLEAEWMDIEGAAVPELLRQIAVESRTGTLRLRSGDGDAALTFAAGQLVACTSDRDERQLGHLLVNAGIISDEQRLAALEAHRASGIPFGSSIIGSGLVTQQDLEAMIRTKARHEIADATQWASGQMTFIPADALPESLVPVAIDVLVLVDELAMDGNGDGSNDGHPFIGRASGRSRTYHRQDCRSARHIAVDERVVFDSETAAEEQQYKACKRCLPPESTE